MSQAQALTTAQLQAYASQLQNGSTSDVEQVYADLYSKGYSYAGWAGGVASENTITGVSAVNFLTGSALMGWGGPQCRNLPQATLNSIKLKMAEGYVQVLMQKSLDGQGLVSEDIKYSEARVFHDAVFRDHNLSVDNWTLNTPMELVRQSLGDDAVEALWKEIRDTGGDGIDGTRVSVKLYNTIRRLSFSEDPNIRDQALAWIDQVPGFANWDAIGRSVDTVMEWLENTAAGRFWAALSDLTLSHPLFVMSPGLNVAFTAARNFFFQRDPLVLDLDGDGLELTAAGGSALFDHNADGIRTGTGWARPDDGLLVRDLNGNGLIDTGRELFGVDTFKSNGQLATQGFDALADLDSNADGQITSADAAWSELQVWRDLNQDGITQAGELNTLASLNITQIGLNGSSTGPQAGQTIRNNFVALSTTYTRAGVARTVGAIDLEVDAFFSDIPPGAVDEAGSPVTITAEAQALPQMNGSGMVRNLRAAMSQTGTAADELEAAVAAFAGATSRGTQRAMLGGLVTEWAQTSSYWSSLEDYLGGTVTLHPPGGITAAYYRNMLAVLEAFSGSRFYTPLGAGRMPGGQSVTTSNGATHYVIAPSLQQAQMLQRAYQVLRESAYGALVMQTRLKPYLDSIELVIDENGVGFDTAGLDALVQAAVAANTLAGLGDALDLLRCAKDSLSAVGWSPEAKLAGVLSSLTMTPAIQAFLDQERVVWAGASATTIQVTVNYDGYLMLGNALDNTITGSTGGGAEIFGLDGNDTLTAAGTSDALDGGAGHDVLTVASATVAGTAFRGGTGNDTITGGRFDDLYLYARGDGADTITDDSMGSPHADVLRFEAGIEEADVGAHRSGNDMVINLAGQAGDQITIKNWFLDTEGRYRLEFVSFASGVNWTGAQLSALALQTSNTGTAGNDTLTGTASMAETIQGMDGNDTLISVGNGDTLDGGAGTDVLQVSSANLAGTVFRGGTGNDTITGGRYDDLYLYSRGDGADTITDNSQGGTHVDELRFADGIVAADVDARRAGNDLVISVAGQAGDEITVKNWFLDSSGYYRIEQLSFANGTHWTAAHLTALAQQLRGTSGNDVMTGSAVLVESIHGLDGNDTLTAVGNSDTLDGGAGNDVLKVINAEVAGTVFRGGTGNDTMTGGRYDDLYLYARGDGADTILDDSMGSPHADVLRFAEGILEADVDAQRSGNDLLITVAGQAGDQITIKNWFLNTAGRYRLEYASFASGVNWTGAQLTALTLNVKGTAGDDVLTGNASVSEVLYGFDGNDTLTSVGNSDTLDGGAGNDLLKVVNAEVAGTVFRGGTGNDTIIGGRYDDLYLYARGDGTDTITDDSMGSPHADVLRFSAGIAEADVSAVRSGNDIVINVAGQAGDQITIKNWFLDTAGRYRLEYVSFASGVNWTGAQLSALALQAINTGTSGNDVLTGSAPDIETLYGMDGNDTLTAVGNSDTLDGGAGNDLLQVSSVTVAGTIFKGGTGNDTLIGGRYDDLYLFARGDGADTITDNSMGSPHIDMLKFAAGITEDQLWFSQSGNHLDIGVIGTSDSTRISNWFTSANNQIELFELSDGQRLLNSQVNNLVQAMAAFAPPAPGETTLPATYQTALAPVIAANWN